MIGIRKLLSYQPQRLLRPAHYWLQRGLSFAVVRAGGAVVDVVSAATPSTNSSTARPTRNGLGSDFTGAQVIEFSDRAPYRLSQAMTLIAGLEIDAFSNYTGIAFKQSSYWKTSFEWRHGRVSHNNSDPNGVQAVFIRGNDVVTGEYCSVGGTSDLGYRASAVSVADASLLSSPVFYQNGLKLSTSTVGASAGTVVDGGAFRIGQRFDGVVQLDGRISFLYGFSRQLTDSEIAVLSATPWQIFELPKVFIPSSAAVVTPTLTAASAVNIGSTYATPRVTFSR